MVGEMEKGGSTPQWIRQRQCYCLVKKLSHPKLETNKPTIAQNANKAF